MSELPEGWTKKTFNDVFDRLQYGLTAKASPNSEGVRFLRITDIENGEIDWDAVPSCEQVDDDIERYYLRDGDFVFARSGSVEKAARVTNPPEAVFASYLIQGTPLDKKHADWLAWFVKSPRYLEQVRAADLLQIGPDDGEGPAVFRVELGSDAKESLNEPELPDHIALRQPPDLPLPDQMHRFVTVDRPQCPFCRPEPQTRRHALLDKSMVLLNDVVQIR